MKKLSFKYSEFLVNSFTTFSLTTTPSTDVNDDFVTSVEGIVIKLKIVQLFT